jgi:hypothetical protein
MLQKLGLWWHFDGRYMHKEFARGVKNLWRWFPTIWKDRDWDGHYIYELIRVKLEHQAKYIGERDFYTEAVRDAERMRLVARLIKLQQDETYAMEYMDYYVTNFEFVPTDETEKWFTMKDELVSDNLEEYIKKYPLQHKRVLAGKVDRYRRPIERKDRKLIAMEIAHENQERCKRLIFSIMNDHIERWWD